MALCSGAHSSYYSGVGIASCGPDFSSAPFRRLVNSTARLPPYCWASTFDQTALLEPSTAARMPQLFGPAQRDLPTILWPLPDGSTWLPWLSFFPGCCSLSCRSGHWMLPCRIRCPAHPFSHIPCDEPCSELHQNWPPTLHSATIFLFALPDLALNRLLCWLLTWLVRTWLQFRCYVGWQPQSARCGPRFSFP